MTTYTASSRPPRLLCVLHTEEHFSNPTDNCGVPDMQPTHAQLPIAVWRVSQHPSLLRKHRHVTCHDSKHLFWRVCKLDYIHNVSIVSTRLSFLNLSPQQFFWVASCSLNQSPTRLSFPQQVVSFCLLHRIQVFEAL